MREESAAARTWPRHRSAAVVGRRHRSATVGARSSAVRSFAGLVHGARSVRIFARFRLFARNNQRDTYTIQRRDAQVLAPDFTLR